ncbi:class I SAM-dependent RNA methyltransferase [Neisseriaceae bacterium CLB008]
MTSLKLFVSCPRGLETVLADELSTLGANQLKATDGGVACVASLATLYRINLHSRVASRVLLQVGYGKIRDEHDVFRLASNVVWTDYFQVHQTIKVKVEAKGARVTSLDFVGLKIKDAVCDVFRAACGERPSVDKRNPDIRIQAFLNHQEAFLFIDTSGEALFKRGYRQETGEAPLRENLAAGLLRLAGFDGSQTLLDPMCGSGTIAIEAALIAKNRAVGLNRRFGFEKLAGFDRALWAELCESARAQEKECTVHIAASDINRFLIKEAIKNAQNAEVDDVIAFSVKDIVETKPKTETGLIVTNPPYGVRLEDEEELAALYPQLGAWLKQNFTGWTTCFFTGDLRFPKLIRLAPKRKWPLFNGAIDCRLFVIDMVAGSNRRKDAE